MAFLTIARSRATCFRLQISRFPRAAMRRETSRVSFLMCPFCVRVLLTSATTLEAHEPRSPDPRLSPAAPRFAQSTA
jgi:hypothetical protein